MKLLLLKSFHHISVQLVILPFTFNGHESLKKKKLVCLSEQTIMELTEGEM